VRIQKESSHDSDEEGEIEIEENVDDVNVLCPVTDSCSLIKGIDIMASRTPSLLSENKIPVNEFQNDHSSRMDIKKISDDKICDTKVESMEEMSCGELTDVSENPNSLVLVSNGKNFESDLKERTSDLSSLQDCSEGRKGGKGNSCSLGLSHQDILESIFNLPPPTEELVLDAKTITEEEKVIHVEFFEGRLAKTPKRYLKVSE
jgi:hypothetical protein